MKKYLDKIKNKKGFTIIELIVVIAVLAILVLLAAPRFLGYTKDANLAAMQSDIKALQNSGLIFNVNNDDKWPILANEDTVELNTLSENYEGVGYKINADDVDVNLANSLDDYVLSPNYSGGVFYVPGVEDRDGDVHYTIGNNSFRDGEYIVDGNDDTIPGPQPDKSVDVSEQTGEYKFHGEVNAEDLITGEELAEQIGLTAGTSQHSTEPWLKFTKHDESTGELKSTIFVAKKPLRYGLSWDQIDAAYAVFGNGPQTSALDINGQEYKVRLLKGSTKDPSSTTGDRDAPGSEWNQMLLPIHENATNNGWTYSQYVEDDIEPIAHTFGSSNGMYTNEDLLTNHSYGSGSYSWTQETTSGGSRVIRGSNGVSYSYNSNSDNTSAYRGWRPALELVAE